MSGPSPAALLTALQLGDSAFPSGAFVASWGLEATVAAGDVAGEDGLGAFVTGQLRWRWSTADRVALVRAHRRAGDLRAVAAVDAEVEAVTLAPLARLASAGAGGALLQVHAALGWSGAVAYRRWVAAGRAHGHLPVAQGLVARWRGLDEDTAALVAGYQLAASLVAAGLRLGLVGHVGAQRVLDSARPLVADLAGEPVGEHLVSSAVAADLAMVAHESLPTRLFAC